MAETDRDEELMHVLGVELLGDPPAEGWRTNPEIDGNIKDTARRAADELTHGRRHVLAMNAAQDAFAGPRVVVLHELVRDPVVDVLLPVVAFEEEPPLVSADGRLDDDDPFQGRSADGQAQCK